MTDDTKKSNEKKPGEKREGTQHYNPGNQSGKEAEMVPKDEPVKKESLNQLETGHNSEMRKR